MQSVVKTAVVGAVAASVVSAYENKTESEPKMVEFVKFGDIDFEEFKVNGTDLFKWNTTDALPKFNVTKFSMPKADLLHDFMKFGHDTEKESDKAWEKEMEKNVTYPVNFTKYHEDQEKWADKLSKDMYEMHKMGFKFTDNNKTEEYLEDYENKTESSNHTEAMILFKYPVHPSEQSDKLMEDMFHFYNWDKDENKTADSNKTAEYNKTSDTWMVFDGKAFPKFEDGFDFLWKEFDLKINETDKYNRTEDTNKTYDYNLTKDYEILMVKDLDFTKPEFALDYFKKFNLSDDEHFWMTYIKDDESRNKSASEMSSASFPEEVFSFFKINDEYQPKYNSTKNETDSKEYNSTKEYNYTKTEFDFLKFDSLKNATGGFDFMKKNVTEGFKMDFGSFFHGSDKNSTEGSKGLFDFDHLVKLDFLHGNKNETESADGFFHMGSIFDFGMKNSTESKNSTDSGFFSKWFDFEKIEKTPKTTTTTTTTTTTVPGRRI